MADLYTSLVRAKQELNGGVLPAMTPLTERAREYLDPAFTIGMGALDEDAEKGLRCPVRGCGGWYHELSRHVEWKHTDMGGTRAIRSLLSIPKQVNLVSQSLRQKRRDVWARRVARGERFGFMNAETRAKRGYVVAQRGWGKERMRIGTRNLRNSCEMQIAQRLLSVADKIGRSPSCSEAELLDKSLVYVATQLYGSWTAAKAAVGLRTARSISLDDVLAQLGAYYEAHGTLPSATVAQSPHRVPLIPTYTTVLRAFGTKNWTRAMEAAASLLDIHGGRYGLPERQTA